MKQLILTAAYGYTSEQLRAFLRSARVHLPDAEIVLFASGAPGLAERIAAEHPRARVVVPADAAIRDALWRSKKLLRMVRDVVRPLWSWRRTHALGSFGTALLEVTLARYAWMHELIAATNFDGPVLLTDSRDVYFQGDPFESHAAADLVCGEEPRSIGACQYNSAWIEHVYTRPWLERLAARPVLCAGVTLGSAAAIRTYLAAVVSEISTHRARLLRGGGLDQGIHNKLLHGDGLMPFNAIRNGESLLATLHYSDLSEFRFDENAGLRTRDGEAVKIVHQFDRHASLRDWAESRYA